MNPKCKTTHHLACDCREEKIKKLVEAASEVLKLKWGKHDEKVKDLDNLKQALAEFEGGEG